MSEAQLHRAVATYLTFALPKDAVWTTVGHGGGGKVRGAQLKAMGLKAGWPDIQILMRGLFVGIELKGPKGKTSPEQDSIAHSIEKAGGHYYVCRSLDDVITAVRLVMNRCSIEGRA